MRWQSKVVAFIILLIAVAACAFYAGMQYAQRLALTSQPMFPQYPQTISVPTNTGVFSKAGSNLPVAQTYMSTKQSYAFSLYKLSTGDMCTYTMQKMGRTVDISKLLGVSTLPCSKTENGLSSGFEKWVDDQSFVITTNGRKLYVDVANMTVTKQ